MIAPNPSPETVAREALAKMNLEQKTALRKGEAAIEGLPFRDRDRLIALGLAVRAWPDHTAGEWQTWVTEAGVMARRLLTGWDTTAALSRPAADPVGPEVSEAMVQRLYEFVGGLGVHGPNPKPWSEQSLEHQGKWKAALTAALAARQASVGEWRPISNKPYSEPALCWSLYTGEEVVRGPGRWANMTHWQPLPAAPSPSTVQREG